MTKKQLIILTVVLVLAFALSVLSSGFRDWNAKCWFGHDYDDNGVCQRCGEHKETTDEKVIDHNEQLVASINQTKGIRLMRSAAQVDDTPPHYAGGSNFTLTAELESNITEGLNTNVTWSISWKDRSSTWASGKTVTDYVTVTQSTTNGLQATVTCKQAFGEPAIVKVVPEDNENVNATCQFDYIKRVTSIAFDDTSPVIKIASDDKIGTLANGLTDLDINVQFGVGTIAGELYFDKVTLTPKDDMRQLAKSNGVLTPINPYSGTLELANPTITAGNKVNLSGGLGQIMFRTQALSFLEFHGGGYTTPNQRKFQNWLASNNGSPLLGGTASFTFSLRYNGTNIQSNISAAPQGLCRFDTSAVTTIATVNNVTMDNTNVAF